VSGSVRGSAISSLSITVSASRLGIGSSRSLGAVVSGSMVISSGGSIAGLVGDGGNSMIGKGVGIEGASMTYVVIRMRVS